MGVWREGSPRYPAVLSFAIKFGKKIIYGIKIDFAKMKAPAKLTKFKF